MFQNFYEKLTGINLVVWISAYIAIITVYTQLPENTWAIRPFISDVALIMIGVILLAAIEKIRSV
jgi:hypothetical protein